MKSKRTKTRSSMLKFIKKAHKKSQYSWAPDGAQEGRNDLSSHWRMRRYYSQGVTREKDFKPEYRHTTFKDGALKGHSDSVRKLLNKEKSYRGARRKGRQMLIKVKSFFRNGKKVKGYSYRR